MSTLETAIVIDDDDDDDVDALHDDALHGDDDNNPPGVEPIRAILPGVSPSEARNALAASGGGDAERALHLLLLTSRDGRGVAPCGAKKKRPRPDASQQGTSSELPVNNPHILSAPELSDEWHRCVASLLDKQAFVDSSFPPCSKSIDGRSRTHLDASPREGSAERLATAVIMCKCGQPAAARTVQGDGPNYGRFYLACGRLARRRRTTPTPPSPSIVPSVPCNFFQWDPHGSMGAARHQWDGSADAADAASSSWPKLEWVRFDSRSHGCRMVVPAGPSPEHVRQGRLGNCWFLSALAVVAERPDLIRRIVPHEDLNDRGCYQINLCLDGRWTPVIVDSYLPVVLDGNDARRKGRPSDGIRLASGHIAHGAFCATVARQLWPALVEKAYAKSHTCYRNLSGGFIAEALHDLTGAPTETTVFSTTAVTADDRDELWARLVSFHEAGFVMGVATASGGEGLVGGHAYSILDVIEVHDSIVGEQCKVTDFFAVSKPHPRSKVEDCAYLDESTGSSCPSQGITRTRAERATIRLVRIRNPWGSREWKGAWSADSDRWTMALRKRLKGSWSKGDGTFFMSYDDVLTRFHHLDVAKTRRGWHFESTGGTFQLAGPTGVESFNSIFRIHANERTLAYLSIIQPKKRANTTTRYYYCDPSFLLLKRRRDRSDRWICETSVLCGVQRVSTCEVFLDPAYEYACVPFSCLSISMGPYPFRLACYSASKVEMTQDPKIREFSTAFITTLHKELLTTNCKVVHHVSDSCLLVVIHGDGCLYFVAVNGSNDSVLSLRLVVEDSCGIVVLLGRSDDTHFIAPGSQRLLASASRTGGTSGTSSLKFRYLSQTAPSRTGSHDTLEHGAGIEIAGFTKAVPITVAGDLLCQRFESTEKSEKGSHSIDVAGWIPQIGSSRGR